MLLHSAMIKDQSAVILSFSIVTVVACVGGAAILLVTVCHGGCSSGSTKRPTDGSDLVQQVRPPGSNQQTFLTRQGEATSSNLLLLCMA